MMDREWKLGKDVFGPDNLLDGFTFDDVILALHHERDINRFTAREVMKDILRQRIEDMDFLFLNNVDEIIKEAKKGRE